MAISPKRVIELANEFAKQRVEESEELEEHHAYFFKELFYEVFVILNNEEAKELQKK